MGDRLRRIPARTRTRSGACMLDTYMRTTPTHILLCYQGQKLVETGRRKRVRSPN